MYKNIASFLVKAFPRAFGELMKPGRKVTSLFKGVGETLGKSKLYKKFENTTRFLTGAKPGEIAQDCIKSVVEGTITNAMMGGISNIFSRSPKQYSFPTSKSSTGSLGNRMPGIDMANQGQQQNIRSFNSMSSAVSSLDKVTMRQAKDQKQIIDNYKKKFSSKKFSLPELMGMGSKLEQELESSKRQLVSNLRSGNHNKKLSELSAVKNLKTPTVKSEEAREIAMYTRDALEDVSNQIYQNMKKINDNLNKSISEMNKTEEEMAIKMMSNLGNYNVVAYKKLSDTITKTEEIAFKKQQESSIDQTGMIVDKLDTSHEYDVKATDAIRSEILANTQTMYELDKQNRSIEETYRALEEKNNNGVTLSSIYALLRSVSERVQMSLKTPDVINENVRDAMNSIAHTAGYELGKFIQTLKELFNGLIVAFEKVYMGIYRSNIPFKEQILGVAGTVFKGLEWINKTVFSGLLGAEDSVVRDMFGNGGSYTLEDLENRIQEDKSSEVSSSEVKNPNGTIAFSPTDSTIRLNSAGINEGNLSSDIDGIMYRGTKLYARTKSGFYIEVKNDRGSNETLDSFTNRKIKEAQEAEYLEIQEDRVEFGNYKPSRDNAAQAAERYSKNEAALEDVITIDEKETIHLKSTKGNRTLPKSEVNSVFLSSGRYKEFLKVAGPKKTIVLDHELKLLILKLLRDAAKRGIRVKVTDCLRIPDKRYPSFSNHMRGLAVDLSIECFKENGGYMSMSDLFKTYWLHNAEPPVSKPNSVTYISTIIALSDLSKCYNNRDKFLKKVDGTPISDFLFDYVCQWYELVSLAVDHGISVGATLGDMYFQARFGVNSKAGEVVDIVHMAMGGIRSTIDINEVNNLEIMASDNLQESTRGFFDNVFKGTVEGHKASIVSKQINNDFNEQVQSFEKGMLERYSGDITKKGNTLYYNDHDQYGNQYKVRSHYEDSDGNYKRRNGNRLALTSEYNMMLYDKAKSGQLDKQTYEELKKVIESYEKLNPDERSKLNFETKRSIEEMKAIYKEFGLDKPTVVNNIINNNVNNITTLERDPRTYSDSGDMKME